MTRKFRLFSKNISGSESEKTCIAAEACPVGVFEGPVQWKEDLLNGGSILTLLR